MIEIIEKTIQMLRERVQSNLARIKENQSRIRTILQEPISEQRTGKFDQHYSNSKLLLKENQDLINLQITLVNFLEKYRKTLDVEINESTAGKKVVPDIQAKSNKEPVSQYQSKQEKSAIAAPEELDMNKLFEKTISGMIAWTSQHPMFLNEEFYNNLMQYYLENEDYEACGVLTRSRSQI